MRVLWPWSLYLLALVPLWLLAYALFLRRRRRYAIRYSSLALVRPVGATSRLRRHLPFALLLAGFGILTVALARPVAVVAAPTGKTTVILTLDVSGSMRSADIPPSRLEAAEAAALDFIGRQKPTTQIGIVAFAGNAELVQPPTTDQEALAEAIRRLSTARYTAIGSGILKSLDAISEVDPDVAASDGVATVTPTPVPPGVMAADVIVLLTDGVSNAGIPPLEAAQQAVARGVRIYTIGFGTENGSIPSGGFQGGGGGPFGGGGGGGRFGGGGFRTGIDEATLKQIAELTGGTYHTAASAEQLVSVFQALPTTLITKQVTTEVTVGFTALGTLLAIAAAFLSLLWGPRG